MRMMGLDYGSTTVGVAMSDALGYTSQPKETIVREKENHLRRTLAKIAELTEENEIGLIVLGRPVRMDGTDGTRVAKTEEFREALKKRVNVPIVWQDERLTTVAADRTMMEVGVRRENRKEYVDKIAATLILQGYLDRRSLGE